MTVSHHRPLKAFPRPAWRLNDLPRLLAANDRNTVTYIARDGTRRCCRFPEVRRQAIAALNHLVRSGVRLQSGTRCAIMAPTGYQWLIAALACLFGGVEIVAVPENLSDTDVALSLAALPVDLAILSPELQAYEAFAKVRRVSILDLGGADSEPLMPMQARLSVVAFTSGSTSTSKLKAFRIDPESTEVFIETFAKAFGLSHEDNWVICHPFSHIVHFEYALGGLAWGYDVTLADTLSIVLHGATLRPSILITVPSVYEQLATQIRKRLPKSGMRSRLIRWSIALPVNRLTKVAARLWGPLLFPEVGQVLSDRLKVMIIGAAPSTTELRRFFALVGLPVYEGYGMSETQMLSCNVGGGDRFDTVGRAWPGVELRLLPDKTLMARLHFHRTRAYLNVPTADSRATFQDDGWIDTGDLGEIDRGGFLRIVGRKKEILITNRGKNVNPAPLEAKLRMIPGVAHAFVFGNNKPFIIALLAPTRVPFDASAQRAAAEHLSRINSELGVHERIINFRILPEPLSVENGLLTRSGKPRKTAIEHRFHQEIEELYA